MLNDEAKLTNLPGHLLKCIILPLVMPASYPLLMWWYYRKISQIQNGEQKLSKNISANSFNNPNHY